MPRYFFHVHDGVDRPDRDGTVLPGPGEAASQAIVVCGEMLKDLDGAFWRARHWRMEVADDQGKAICALTFSGELF
jgi:hypothetical protein